LHVHDRNIAAIPIKIPTINAMIPPRLKTWNVEVLNGAGPGGGAGAVADVAEGGAGAGAL
jgi:hypothetical protein